MRQHRHAARHGGQSAYQAGQRRSTGTSAEKFSTNARLPSEPTPKSKKEKPVTLARGNGRTNHRRAPSATWATARRLPDFRADAPRLENALEDRFRTASENGFPKPLARARRQASLRSQIGCASDFLRSDVWNAPASNWRTTRRRSIEQPSDARHDFLSSGPPNALRAASSRICGGVSVIPHSCFFFTTSGSFKWCPGGTT